MTRRGFTMVSGYQYLKRALSHPEILNIGRLDDGTLSSIAIREADSRDPRTIVLQRGGLKKMPSVEVLFNQSTAGESTDLLITGPRALDIFFNALDAIYSRERADARRLIQNLDASLNNSLGVEGLDSSWNPDPMDKLSVIHTSRHVQIRCTYTYDAVHRRLDGWKIQICSLLNNAPLETRKVFFEMPLQRYFSKIYKSTVSGNDIQASE